MAKKKYETCKRCEKKIGKSEEIALVIDITYHKDLAKQYKTFDGLLCNKCLKEFIALMKEFKVSKRKGWMEGING